MSTAEIALNTPRSDTPVDAARHKGLEGLPKHVELNVPNDFNRRFNENEIRIENTFRCGLVILHRSS